MNVLHITVCVLLIFVVLIQTSKGSEMGAAFGGSSQTLFGSSGPATFLGKMTTVIATVFMLTSLWLAYFAVHNTGSIIDNGPIPAVEQTLPVDQEGAATTPAAIPPDAGKAE
jgi:preprotein translocase subunit SecG